MRKNGVLYLLILLSSFITSNIRCVLGDSWHFNTAVLSNPQKVREHLKADEQQEGYTYEEVDFHPVNDQSKTLKGIFLERPNARATIVCTPGFWPGLKEGLAALVKIMPKDCNLFFIELTNHGESGSHSCCSSAATCLTPSCCLGLPSPGNCLPMPGCLGSDCMNCSFTQVLKTIGRLKKYGLAEHFDIMGALDYTAQKTNRKPIVLFGWCAGAFLSARTLVKLKELSQEAGQDLINAYNIQGLIFDSGFGSLTDMIKGSYHFINKKMLPKCMSCLSSSEQDTGEMLINTFGETVGGVLGTILGGIKKGLGWLGTGSANLLFNLLEAWVRPSLEKYSPETNLYDKIHNLKDLPIYVIHCKNDKMAKWEQTQRLVNCMQNKELWLIEKSSHAENHLKHKEEYHTRMRWINTIIHDNPLKNDANTNTNTKKTKVNNPIRQRMIEIINAIIKIIEELMQLGKKPADANTEQQAKELLEQSNKLEKEFKKLLENPKSDLSPKTKNKIKEKLKEIQQENDPTKIIETLREIRKMLLDPNYTPKPSSKKRNTGSLPTPPNGQKGNPKYRYPKIKGAKKSQKNQKNKPNNTHYAPPKRKSKSSSPSRSRSSYTPSANSSGSSYPGNSGYYPSNNYGNPGNPGANYPSYGGTGGSSMPSGSWPQRTNQQKQEPEKNIVTKQDILYLDEIYGPEMEDKPDAPKRRHYRRYQSA